MAERLGLGDEVCEPLQQWFTRWDGSGVPDGVGGDDVARSVRLFHLADCVEVAHQRGGIGAAIELARSRRAKQFDPEVVDAFCAVAADLFDGLDETDRLADGDRQRPATAAPADRIRSRRGAGGDRRLHRSAVAVTVGPFTGRCRSGGTGGRVVRPPRRRCGDPSPCSVGARRRHARGAGHDPREARSAHVDRVRADADALLLHRAHPGPAAGAGPHRRGGVARERTPRRVRLPPRPVRLGDSRARDGSSLPPARSRR